MLHTDAALLPRRRRAWASWNFHLQEQPAKRTTVTYDMNRLQALDAEREYCVTLNRTDAIDPERVLDVAELAHPSSPWGANRPAALGRDQRTPAHPLLRAYWGSGFHEDGVQSALRVCERFGAAL